LFDGKRINKMDKTLEELEIGDADKIDCLVPASHALWLWRVCMHEEWTDKYLSYCGAADGI
jgi:hypothetical protein